MPRDRRSWLLGHSLEIIRRRVRSTEYLYEYGGIDNVHMNVRYCIGTSQTMNYCPSVERPTGRASQSHWDQVPLCTSPSTPEYIGHSICQSVVGSRQCNAMLDGIFSGDALVNSFTFNVEHSDCTLYTCTCMYRVQSTWMLDHIGP